jgi:hypothetical protein
MFDFHVRRFALRCSVFGMFAPDMARWCVRPVAKAAERVLPGLKWASIFLGL